MNLSVEQLMARAIRALETGQPGLAVLYMRRALVLLAVDRTERLVPSALSVLGGFFDAMAAGLLGVTSALSDMADAVVSLFTSPAVQADFALVDEP